MVTGWRPHRGKTLQAGLPGSKGGKWRFRQLFLNGERQTRARWPKYEPENPLYGGWALTEGPGGEDATVASTYKEGTFRHRWAKPTEVEVVYLAGVGGWGSREPITAIDESRRTITLPGAGWQFDVPGWYQPVCSAGDNRF